MLEQLEDEAICTTHSSVECDKKNTAYYETSKRGCKLELSSDKPYTSHCNFRMVIKAPSVPV